MNKFGLDRHKINIMAWLTWLHRLQHAISKYFNEILLLEHVALKIFMIVKKWPAVMYVQ